MTLPLCIISIILHPLFSPKFTIAYLFLHDSCGTVVNNLRPDRFAGQKTLSPYYCRKPTLWLYDSDLEVLTAPVLEKGILSTYTINDISTVETFNIFSYDEVLGQESNP